MRGALRKPDWLTIRPNFNENYLNIKKIIKKNNLNSVCKESRCPNIHECWSSGTATFMILGDVCTRNCRFCATNTNKEGCIIDTDEAEKISEAIRYLNLNYAVLTSVCRDDLEDEGSEYYADCVKKIKENSLILEVLIPDFGFENLKRVVKAKPDLISHNLETVKRLQENVRDRRFNYEKSLNVLKNIKTLNKNIFTKSSIMVGLGEKEKEVFEVMEDLRNCKVDILTIGQYLRPSVKHLDIKEYVSLDKFEYYKKAALDMGFLSVASGPFVRSSYKAGELFLKNK